MKSKATWVGLVREVGGAPSFFMDILSHTHTLQSQPSEPNGCYCAMGFTRLTWLWPHRDTFLSISPHLSASSMHHLLHIQTIIQHLSLTLTR